MATLQELCWRGLLIRYDADLGPHEQEHRSIYATEEFDEWVEDHLPYHEQDWHQTLTPLDQVDQMFADFVRGRRMSIGSDIKKLEPLGHHVWEMKPQDIRIFGYFYRKGVFIAACGEYKRNLKPARKYGPLIRTARDVMSGIPLDPPACETGNDLHALL